MMDGNFTLSVLGIPVFSAGVNPKAIIAVGVAPIGFISIGWFSMGVFALGQASLGIFSFGQISVGIITVAQLGLAFILVAQVGFGLLAGFGQAVAGFISNCFGYYKVDIKFKTPLKENWKIVSEKVSANPRPLIYWSISWFTAIAAFIIYFNDLRGLIMQVIEKGNK
jgi:hypothetical protein